jgi:SAM-dependent methyltransferase
MTENQWDKLLRIRTTGRDDSHSDSFRFPYEPTPYSVLERLADSGYITKKNTVLDYGCGKGRVSFFLSYQLRCRSVGIEYDDRIYGAAVENKMSAVSGERVDLVLAKAEEFAVPQAADRMFFFNPFSVEILRKVLARICESYSRAPREILLFFYYPSEEYMADLMTEDLLEFEDEIDCRDLFPGNNERENILIFSVTA